MVQVVKNPHANSGEVRDVGSISGSGRVPEGGNAIIDRGAWKATIHGATKELGMSEAI